MRFVKKVHQMIWHIKSRSFTSALRASFCTGNVRYILLYKGAGKCQAWVERTVVVCQFPKELLLYLSLPLDYTIHTQCMKIIKKSLIFNACFRMFQFNLVFYKLFGRYFATFYQILYKTHFYTILYQFGTLYYISLISITQASFWSLLSTFLQRNLKFPQRLYTLKRISNESIHSLTKRVYYISLQTWAA